MKSIIQENKKCFLCESGNYRKEDFIGTMEKYKKL